ncbi:MAG TPA: fructosamine kinase family protein [Usitatibacteraceae bacterium]|nr:fructosamine kinase family protein [Usitatibacteraceae bacterium]
MTPELRAALERTVMDATRGDWSLTAAEPVSGGCIHTALCLEGADSGGKTKHFAKLAPIERAPMLLAEAQGLEAIHAAGAVRVPAVVARDDDGETAWLILEWLELVPLSAASGARLGAALAAQHRVPQAKFGWEKDNYIGSSPQLNGWSEDWLAFWSNRRIHAQLRMAMANRYPSRMIDRGERLLTDCAVFFRTHGPVPSLLHGDLWGGNASALGDGTPVVFDPAVYCGDREADLAMTELFGGFPRDFHSAYRNAWPLDDGYAVRRDFYNLYHVLNHANLFAGAYVEQGSRMIERLLSEIR